MKHFFVNFTVACPRDSGRRYPMSIELVEDVLGEKFPLPCNGCDMYSGSAVCQKCTAVITLMFRRTPGLSVHKPVTLDFSLLE